MASTHEPCARSAVVLFAIAAVTAACPRPSHADVAANACPMALPGTSVVTENTPDGIALRFITTGDVRPLRARVRALAVRFARTGTAARVEDVANGAQILLTPDTPARLDTLRALVRKRAEYMAAGRCDVP